ncbi:MAG: hypothetical protein NTY15_07465 [Planctomycetota bacterium]|nr:hypothetical protein [Planctomycetota bacterium]
MSFCDEESLRSILAKELVDGTGTGVPKPTSSSGLSLEFFCSANGSVGGCRFGSGGNRASFSIVLGELAVPIFVAIGGGVSGEFDSGFKPDGLPPEFEAIVGLPPFLAFCVFRITSRQSAITRTPTTTLYGRLLLAVAGFGTDWAAGMASAGIGVATDVDSTLAVNFSAGPLVVATDDLAEFAIPPTMFG